MNEQKENLFNNSNEDKPPYTTREEKFNQNLRPQSKELTNTQIDTK